MCGQIEPLRQNGYALKHTTPEHKAGEIGLKAVKQNEHALKHAAPEHKADGLKAVKQNEYALKHEAKRLRPGRGAGSAEPESPTGPRIFLHAAYARQYAWPHPTSRETHWASREAVAYWDGA